MAKPPDISKKSGKTPKSKAPNSKASRPDVQPIGPALAELLNPAINRGDAGMGSGTGLQPPPDNSWDRRSGGEAAAHRARASTRGTSDDVAKRDVSVGGSTRGAPHPTLPRKRERATGGKRRISAAKALRAEKIWARNRNLRPLSRLRGRARAGASNKHGFDESPQREFAPANYGTAATIPTLDPELAKQFGFTTEEEDAAAMARPPRNKMEALGVAATADALENLIREGRPEFRGEDGQVEDLDAASPAPPGEIRRRRALRDQVRIRAEGRPAHRDRRTGRGHPRATTAPRCCSASPAAARPTPWPR